MHLMHLYSHATTHFLCISCIPCIHAFYANMYLRISMHQMHYTHYASMHFHFYAFMQFMHVMYLVRRCILCISMDLVHTCIMQPCVYASHEYMHYASIHSNMHAFYTTMHFCLYAYTHFHAPNACIAHLCTSRMTRLSCTSVEVSRWATGTVFSQQMPKEFQSTPKQEALVNVQLQFGCPESVKHIL